MRVFCGLKVEAVYEDVDLAKKTAGNRHAVAAEMKDLDPHQWGEILRSLTEYRDAEAKPATADGAAKE